MKCAILFNLSMLLLLLLVCESVVSLTWDEFCKCAANDAQCACDARAFAAAVESAAVASERARVAAWEQEKDEWRQEFQLEKDRVVADADARCQQCDNSAAASGPADDAATALRAKHARELRIELDLLQFPERDQCDVLPQIHFN